MLTRYLPRTAMYGTLAAGLIVMTWWLFTNPVPHFVENIPGMDNKPEGVEVGAIEVQIGALFEQFDGTASTLSADWPRFRGSDFDNISKETIPLAGRWGGGGPTMLWEVELGEGHAGPVVSEGRVYILDYDEEKRADVLRCFSLEDGREIWRRGYSIFIKRNHGMSRTVPAVANGSVVTIGPMCQVMCVDAVTGDFKWGLDLAGTYGTEVPLWYTGQCPLIDGSTAVVAVGGRALLIGLDLESGEVVWETPNPDNWKMSHSSIIPFTIHGRRMYVYCALGGIVGVSAEEGTVGDILLQTTLWNHNVVAPSPLYLGDGR
ncbi:MAG: PQQ-binding-like beta-propeller repeat protein, partial [Acidobacteriota bacterium]